MGSSGRYFLLFKYFVFTRFGFYSSASWCAYLAVLFLFHAGVTLTKRYAGDKNNTTQTDASLSRSSSNLLPYRIREMKLCRKLIQQATLKALTIITCTSTTSVTKYRYLHIELLNMQNFYIGTTKCSNYLHYDVTLKPFEEYVHINQGPETRN